MALGEGNNCLNNIDSKVNKGYKPVDTDGNEIFERFHRETSGKVTNIVTKGDSNATFIGTFSPYKNPLFN